MRSLFEEVKQRSALKQAGAAVLKGTLRNLWREQGQAMVWQMWSSNNFWPRYGELQDFLQWEGPPPMTEVDVTVPTQNDNELPPIIQMVWADDLAFALSASTAQAATSQIRVVARHLFQTCLQHGMRPNLYLYVWPATRLRRCFFCKVRVLDSSSGIFSTVNPHQLVLMKS